LDWWFRAGLEPWDILASATIRGAELLGLPAGWVVGAKSDFTLYESSPATNPGVLGSPQLVFSGGVAETPDAIVAGVRHALTEEVPENPLPGGYRWSLLILAVLGFAVLLGLRHLVQRAAANAADS
jgi:cytosine/adenosine deaminase-related metal-dependent hydrolase